MSFEITESMVRKLLAAIEPGLVKGLGSPNPGQMCVEAAISFALGESHSDGPSCVDPIVRQSKIALNDKHWSSNAARANGLREVAIAQLGSKGVVDGKRYLALVAEGTIREIVPIALRAAASRNPHGATALKAAVVRCEQEGTREAAAYAAHAADAAADAAAYAAAYAADTAAYATDAAAYAADAAAAAAAYATDAAYAAYAAAAAAAAAADAATADAAAAAAVRDSVLTRLANIMVRALQECGSPGCEWLWLVRGETR